MRDASLTGMHLYLTARHLELTDQIRAHVQKRIVHAVEAHAHAHDLNRLEVQLAHTGQRDAGFACHVLLQLPGHHDINVKEEHRDLYAAIDLAEKRLLNALTAFRERRLTNARHPRKYSWRKISHLLRP
jgi:ribosomal subunit interface protein